jgi:hypothetical protein
MEILVTKDRIKKLLLEAKHQFINISVSDHSGRWSSEYYQLEEIKEFKHGADKVTVLLLRSKNAEHTMIDARFVQGIKLDKLLHLDGQLVDTIKVVSKATTLQFSH